MSCTQVLKTLVASPIVLMVVLIRPQNTGREIITWPDQTHLSGPVKHSHCAQQSEAMASQGHVPLLRSELQLSV